MKPSPTPRVAAIHDLSGLGRCSLTAVIPLLSSHGIQVCPLPTALLSSQTDGYKDYFFQDLTESMKEIVAHWKREEITFKGIYSGFLGSPQQAQVVSDFIDDFRMKDQLVVVDPVMGDEGEFYGPYTKSLVGSMKELISKADLITPNFTEAAFLLGEEYKHSIEREELKEWCLRLQEMGPRRVVMTSVPLEGGKRESISLAALDGELKENCFFTSSVKRMGSGFPGTGDIFTSLVMASLLTKKSFKKSIKGAERKIKFVIGKTSAYNLPRREGVLLEKFLRK